MWDSQSKWAKKVKHKPPGGSWLAFACVAEVLPAIGDDDSTAAAMFGVPPGPMEMCFFHPQLTGWVVQSLRFLLWENGQKEQQIIFVWTIEGWPCSWLEKQQGKNMKIVILKLQVTIHHW